MTTKKCTKCKIEYDTSNFFVRRASKDGLQSSCKSCVKKFYEKNKDTRKLYLAEWYEKNKEKKLASSREWYKENKEARTIHVKKYNEINKQAKSLYDKQYYENNKEFKKIYNQTPERKAASKVQKQKRRAKDKLAEGSHTIKEVLQLFELQSHQCVYCNKKIYKTGNNKYHEDHIIPISKGGSNWISNIQLLCPKCNLSKSNKMPEVFAAEFGKLL